MTEAVEIAVEGTGIDALGCGDDEPVPVITCAEDGQEVFSLNAVHLDGSGSYSPVGREIVAWRWSFEHRQDYESPFMPSSSAVDPSFTMTLAGIHRFLLEVEGRRRGPFPASRLSTRCTPHRKATSWLKSCGRRRETPNPGDEGPGAGADIDLHIVHPASPSTPDAPDRDGDGEPDPYFDPLVRLLGGQPEPDLVARRRGVATALTGPLR